MDEISTEQSGELIFSYFDLILGPRDILSIPWLKAKNPSVLVLQFFEFHHPGDFFIHIYKDIITFNQLFGISRNNTNDNPKLFMLTESIPFSIFKQKHDIIQYYESFKSLFSDWVQDFGKIENLTQDIMDGEREINDLNITPLLNILAKYYQEIEFILNNIPDVNSDQQQI